MAANNNIHVTVVVKEGKVLATPVDMSLPCRNMIVMPATNADAPLVSSEVRWYFGGVERVYQLDKSVFTVHSLINGTAGAESGAES